jgi:leucyl aminopeptidase
MTAFIAKNATESIGFIETSADAPLTQWALELAREYSDIRSDIYKLPAHVSPSSFLRENQGLLK